MGEEAQHHQQPNSDIEPGEITEDPPTEQQPPYSWPAIRFDVPPYRAYHFAHQFRTTSSNPNNFLKGLKWYPFHCSLFFMHLLPCPPIVCRMSSVNSELSRAKLTKFFVYANSRGTNPIKKTQTIY